MEGLSWFTDEQRDRWVGLLRFVSSWRTAISEDDGFSEDVIAEAEHRVGVRLPDALREWYRIAGKRDDLARLQNQLLLPPELYVDEGYLIFYSENQGVVRWGIAFEKVGEVDPVVWIEREYHVQSGMKRGWLNEGRRLSVFVFQMIVLDSGLTREKAGLFSVKVSMFKRLQRLMPQIEKFWSHDWPEDPTYFFADADEVDRAEIIVVDIGFRDLLVMGRDKAAFERAKKMLRLKQGD
jgi:hypothetical protein